jgi:GNAT superfamily N-acetyltransferase
MESRMGYARVRCSLQCDLSNPRKLNKTQYAEAFCKLRRLAFLADVFVAHTYRGLGLGLWLVEVVPSPPELRPIRRWLLGTRDAHELYRKFGFAEPTPGVLMERVDAESDTRR